MKGTKYVTNPSAALRAWSRTGYPSLAIDLKFNKMFELQKFFMSYSQSAMTFKEQLNVKYGQRKNKANSLEDIAKLSGIRKSVLQDVFNRPQD